MAFHLTSCLLLAVALFGISAAQYQYHISEVPQYVLRPAANQHQFRVKRAGSPGAVVQAPASAAVAVKAPASAAAVVQAPASVAVDKAATIVQQSSDFNPADNSYAYSYQTDNGISAQSHGFINKEGVYAVEGSFTLYNAQGTPVTINYVADQNGYQAVGDLIPVPDAAIVKSVEYLRSLPPPKEQSV